MPYVKMAMALLDIYFAIMEKANKTEAEQLIFYTEQRGKFRGENAPENLPKPPEITNG